jgi:hypothetical protein
MKWVLARHTDDGTAGVSRLVRGGSDPYGLSSVVPSGFVLPRGFVEGIIRKDETCPPFGVEPRPVSGWRGPLSPSGPVRFVLIVVHSAFRLDARPAAWQTDPHRGTRRANVVGRRDLVVERGMDLGP